MPFPPWPPITFIPYPPSKDGKFRFYRITQDTEHLRPPAQPGIRYSPHPEELEVEEDEEDERGSEYEDRTISPEPGRGKRRDRTKERVPAERRSQRLADLEQARLATGTEGDREPRSRWSYESTRLFAGGGQLETSRHNSANQRKTQQQTQQPAIVPILIASPDPEVASSTTASPQQKRTKGRDSDRSREKERVTTLDSVCGNTEECSTRQTDPAQTSARQPKNSYAKQNNQAHSILAVSVPVPPRPTSPRLNSKRTLPVEDQPSKKTKNCHPENNHVEHPNYNGTPEGGRFRSSRKRPPKDSTALGQGRGTHTTKPTPSGAFQTPSMPSIPHVPWPPPPKAAIPPVAWPKPPKVAIPHIPCPIPLSPPVTPTEPAVATTGVVPLASATTAADKPVKGSREWKTMRNRAETLRRRAKKERRRAATALTVDAPEDEAENHAEDTASSGRRAESNAASTPATKAGSGPGQKKHCAPSTKPTSTSSTKLTESLPKERAPGKPSSRSVKAAIIATAKQREERKKEKERGKKKKERQPKNPKQEKRKKRLESLKNVDGQAYCPFCLKARCAC